MDSFVPAAEAFRKLQLADVKSAAVYIYGATGYGKTRLVHEYLEERTVIYLSPNDEEWNLPEFDSHIDNSGKKCIVVDDMQELRSDEQKKILLELIDRKDIWLIMIGRISSPYWLLPKLAGGNLVVISEDDLWLSAKEIGQIAINEQVELDDEGIKTIADNCKGNRYVVLLTIQQIKSGHILNDELTFWIQQIFAEHLEKNVIAQWDLSLQEFLTQLSVVDVFTLPLAVMITGNDQAADMLEKAENTGDFLFKNKDTYQIRTELLAPLRNRALKLLGLQRYRQCQNNAGLYFEMHRDYQMALKLYEAAENKDSVKTLLVRNARCHMGSGDYYRLRQYYLRLDEKEAEKSPILMSALSMLHSVMMNPDESEKWYDKLKNYAAMAKGGEKREANEQLLYLDIALPHRGNADLVDIIKRVTVLLKNGGMTLSEFSVTNNQPSTMNGGKDFCNWSKNDELLGSTIGGIIERLLGSFGKGIVHAALCESFYEKGGRDEESMQHAIMVQMAADSGGKTELLFAAVGIQIRRSMLIGKKSQAQYLLNSFEERVRKEKKDALLPNINALRCRIALAVGDMETVNVWMDEAPNEQIEFWTLDRYRYLIKVRCYLALGQNEEALHLLERLLYYAEINKRTYIRMESNMLMAVALYRMKREWKTVLLKALNEIQEYGFVRIISEEGEAILPLLNRVKDDYLDQKQADRTWFSCVRKEAKQVAERYPMYISCDTIQETDFSETAIQILRMQSDGLSIREIAIEMDMSERTIKYHAAENYRKLGAKGKTDAVQIAKKLNLL